MEKSNNADKMKMPKGKKRVLIVAYIFPPLSGSGAQRTVKFVKYLRDFGWEPVVITVKDDSFELKDFKMIHDIPEDIKIIRIPLNLKVNNALVNRLIYYYKEVCNSELFNEIVNDLRAVTAVNVKNILWPEATILWADSVLTQINNLDLDSIDCIFSTSGPYSDHILGYMLKKISGKPWIADFRDEWSNNPINWHSDKNLLILRILRSFEQAVVDYCDGMTVVSEQMKENYINDFKVPANKIKKITNGYDEEDFDFISNIKSDKKKFIIVHNGIIYKGREPFEFINAVDELIKNNKIKRDKIKVYLGKASFGENDEHFLDYIKKRNLNDVFVLDYLDHKSSIERTAKASLLLLMTGQGKEWKGVLTGKIFEYLRLCKPILNLGFKDSLAAMLIRRLDRGITAGMYDKNEIYKTVLNYYELWEKGKLFSYAVSQDIKIFERKRLTGTLAAFLDSLSQASGDIITLQKEFEKALSSGNVSKSQELIESYRKKYGENAEYVSMQAVFYESFGEYDKALSSLKKGICTYKDTSDLLYNTGYIYLEQRNYKLAYIVFCLTDYFFSQINFRNDIQNYLKELGKICNQDDYAKMPLQKAKLFYWTWIRENKNFYNKINTNAEKILNDLYKLTIVSDKCQLVPLEIKRSAMNLVLSSIKYICASESGQNNSKPFLLNIINDIADLKDSLRKYFKFSVAICGLKNNTFLIKNVLSSESVFIKAIISDNQKQVKAGSIPLISSDSVEQNEYDYFIIADSNDVKNLLIQDTDKIIDYEKYWNSIFSNPHNWCIYLNSLEQIKESEGLVLGISYGMRDINTRYFRKKICNIAASGQDLYYDFMLLKKALTEQKGSLKYCIICLAKYSFEYDLSLSAQRLLSPYYYYRTHEIHNCKDEIQKNLIDRIDFFKNIIFIDNHTVRFASNYRALCEQHLYQYNNRVFNSNCLDYDSRAKLVAEIKKDFNKNYPLTVKENMNIFKEMLELLIEYQIKPVVVVCPVTEFYRKHANGDRIINDFDRIIADFQKQYEFQYLDYFNSNLFKETDFLDYSHLNLSGAEKFTRLLDTEISW